MNKDELQLLVSAHAQAQESRRVLEREGKEIDGLISIAVVKADPQEIKRLGARRRELPDLYFEASVAEAAAYLRVCTAQIDVEQQLTDRAEAELLAVTEHYTLRQQETERELAELKRRVESLSMKRDGHRNQVESWGTHYGRADARYRQVLQESAK